MSGYASDMTFEFSTLIPKQIGRNKFECNWSIDRLDGAQILVAHSGTEFGATSQRALSAAESKRQLTLPIK